jgi:putative DNA primase/helicase
MKLTSQGHFQSGGQPQPNLKVLDKKESINNDQSLCPPAAYQLTEGGLAQRFFDAHGENFLYVPEWKSFLSYDGRRWGFRGDLEIARLTQEKLIRAMYEEVGSIQNSDSRKHFNSYVRRCDTAHAIAAMTQLLKSKVIASVRDFDQDPFLLNVRNGVIDLRTSQLGQHDRSLMITKVASVTFDEKAKAPRWIRFLNEITNGNKNLIGYLQRTLGYSLTGDVREQKVFFWKGSGSNGKTVAMEATKSVIGEGEYAGVARSDVFMVRDINAIPNEIADLDGKRLVSAAEIEEGRVLALSLIKSLTGNEKIKARRLYQEPFEFFPTFKLFLLVNKLPQIYGTDFATWRRISILPFDTIIPEEKQDKLLQKKLKNERSGILNWLIEGCLDWQREGLHEPDEVKEATLAYRAENDALARFVQARCIRDPELKIAATDLYRTYTRWSLRTELTAPLSQKAFGEQMRERGFLQAKRTNKAIVYLGIGLKVE